MDAGGAEGVVALKCDEDVIEGVGERRRCSGGPVDSEKDRDRNDGALVDGSAKLAGIGVETPSAFASFARRWGASGLFGGRHVGDSVAPGEDACDERGVPLDMILQSNVRNVGVSSVD